MTRPPSRPAATQAPSLMLLFFYALDAPAPRTAPSAKQAKTEPKIGCYRRSLVASGRPPRRGLVILSFCHGPPGRGIHRHFHDVWHAGPHDRMTAFCHRPLGVKLAANSFVFRARGRHDSATKFCHRPLGFNLCCFCTFFRNAGQHDRMTSPRLAGRDPSPSPPF